MSSLSTKKSFSAASNAPQSNQKSWKSSRKSTKAKPNEQKLVSCTLWKRIWKLALRKRLWLFIKNQRWPTTHRVTPCNTSKGVQVQKRRRRMLSCLTTWARPLKIVAVWGTRKIILRWAWAWAKYPRSLNSPLEVAMMRFECRTDQCLFTKTKFNQTLI